MRFLPLMGRGGRSVLLAPRSLLAFATTGAALLLLAERLDGLDGREVAGAMASVPPLGWLLALVATAASFLAVAGYDALFHRWLGTGVGRDRALVSGASAIALSQTLGFGLVTGTLARWRCLPNLSLGDAARMTTYVSLAFMAALGLIAAASTGLGAPAALAMFLLAGLSLLRPTWLPFRLPPLRLMLRLLVLAVIDIGFAAVAFWMLVPGDVSVAFPVLFAAFVLGLGAGLLTGAPGGVGPFELCLVTLLPQFAEPDLLAAILAFRLVYYALPACLAVLALARPLAPRAKVPGPVQRPVLRAEAAGLSGEPGHGFLATAQATLHVAEASQTLVALGDPACGGAFREAEFAALEAAASRKSLWPAAYRIGRRSAALARHKGWEVLAVSEEAWLRPAAFSEAGPEGRQLRRKLSRAVRAGVSVTEAGVDMPATEMTRISAEWVERTGGERGFSMGRFGLSALHRQRVFLAYCEGQLVAFATFHATQQEWVLNLMRSSGKMPDGAMHLLVRTAIATAGAEGVQRFSLAAMPMPAPPPFLRGVARPGLRRFKLAFSPHCTPLYLAAPTLGGLVLAGADVLARIQRPDSAGGGAYAALQQVHDGSSDWSVVPEPVSAHIPSVTQD